MHLLFQIPSNFSLNLICILWIKKLIHINIFEAFPKLLSTKFRSSHPDVSLGKGVLKICSKFTGEHPCRSVISIKLQCIFIEITLRHGCCPVNLVHIFRIPFPKNTAGWQLLIFTCLTYETFFSFFRWRLIFRKWGLVTKVGARD